jgi:hypothetical protein
LAGSGFSKNPSPRRITPLASVVEKTPLREAVGRLDDAVSSTSQVADALADRRKLLAGLVTDGGESTAALRGALRQLGPSTEALREPVAGLHPILADIDKNKEGIGLLGERFSGVFSTNDANGVILRGLGFFEKPDPANLGAPGASGAELRSLQRKSVRALLKACKDNAIACLARYLIPGLPGAARSAGDPLGTAKAKSGGRP